MQYLNYKTAVYGLVFLLFAVFLFSFLLIFLVVIHLGAVLVARAAEPQ